MALSRAAHAAGVQPGMRRGGVLMLMPDARIVQRTPEREAEALQAVAMALLQYTPQVAQAEEATLLLDIGASLRLFGGIRALCRQMRANLRTLGFTACICLRAHRARRLAAGAPRRRARSSSMASLVRRLDRLPCACCRRRGRSLRWFDGIGCRRLDELQRLPRPGLQRRCGRALLDMLDAAYGHSPELLRWIEPPERFQARLELFDRVEHADAAAVRRPPPAAADDGLAVRAPAGGRAHPAAARARAGQGGASAHGGRHRAGRTHVARRTPGAAAARSAWPSSNLSRP